MRKRFVLAMGITCLVLMVGCDKEKENEMQALEPVPAPVTDTVPIIDTVPVADTVPAPEPESRATRIHRWLYGTWELQQARYFLFFKDTTHYEEFPLLIDDQYRWSLTEESIYKECIVSDETETVIFSDSTVYFSQRGGYWKPYDIEEDGVIVIDRGTEYRYERAYPSASPSDFRLHGIRIFVSDSNNMLMYNYTPYKTTGDTVVHREYPCSFHFVKRPKETPRPCPFGMGCL